MNKPQFPEGVSKCTIGHCPRELIDDAISEAWLALLEGRNPNSAVAMLATREIRYRRRYGVRFENEVEHAVSVVI